MNQYKNFYIWPYSAFRFEGVETRNNNMPDSSCTAFSNVTNQHPSYHSPVTSPPHVLGKRVLVARPGLVVVKNGKTRFYVRYV